MSSVLSGIKFFLVTTICYLLVSFPGQAKADQAELDAEREHLLEVFSSDQLDRMSSAVYALSELGYSDPELFDPIEKAIQENLNVKGKQHLDQLAWLIRALGFSGNEKYLPTLQMLASSDTSKVKTFAESSIQNLPKYKRWNSQISKNLDNAPEGYLEQQRSLNMITSGDEELAGFGLTRIEAYYARPPQTDEALIDEVKKQLSANYLAPKMSDQMEDNVAKMCKILGLTGAVKYQGVLNEVAEKSPSPKVRRYAQKYLEKL